jgi:micrococcal nuclease
VTLRPRLVFVAVIPLVLGLWASPLLTTVARAQPPGESRPAIAADGPRGILGSDPRTGQRYIRLRGYASPTIDVACDGKRWTLPPLSRAEDGAVYDVARNIAEQMMNAVECRIFLADQEVPVSRQQLWAAWASPARGPVAPQILVGQVIDVLDGQTILVNLGDRAEAVRYIGISVRENPQPIRPGAPSRASLEVNRQLVARQQVRLELDAQERDRDGRLMAYVYVADTMVNAELVRRGAAEVMTVPPNMRHRDLLVSLEQEAREQRRGLWADPEQPTTPLNAAEPLRHATERPGVPPDGAWTCPRAQPIKGNFSPTTGERCTFHMPDGELYGATKPDRCYATDEEARQDGCRRSRR